MTKLTIWLTELISVIALVSCTSGVAEQLVIEKQVPLSPGHHVMPYNVTRMSNGDLIVFGSNDQTDYRPWAARVTAEGMLRWELLQGPPNGWQDRAISGARFYSAVEMADQSTLLCGTVVPNREPTVVLDQVSADGKLLTERLIKPLDVRGFPNDVPTDQLHFGHHVECLQTKEGTFLLGAVGTSGFIGAVATGWLAQLDGHLDVKSQRFGDPFFLMPFMQTSDGSLVGIKASFNKENSSRLWSLMKVSPSGEILASHPLADDDGPEYLIYPVVPTSGVRLALFHDTFHTEIVSFDDQLRGPRTVVKMHNAGVKKCLELPDGSIAIFGSRFDRGATAAVTRVYRDGGYKVFDVEPAHQSAFYYDAVATGNKNEFAATRWIGVQPVLEWISFK
jgi:hypothetical protein